MLETDWVLWLAAAFAFLYGLGVLVSVIVLLVKSAREAGGKENTTRAGAATRIDKRTENQSANTDGNQQ